MDAVLAICSGLVLLGVLLIFSSIMRRHSEVIDRSIYNSASIVIQKLTDIEKKIKNDTKSENILFTSDGQGIINEEIKKANEVETPPTLLDTSVSSTD